ncbi:MAG TPA: FliH/SctL family protein [Pseudomonadales bacterium]|nr:FliH/SctL family protein [Pseudomonadales bacterium]
MKWHNSITLEQPLADVRLRVAAPASTGAEPAQEQEQAAYERGRRDAEQLFGGQLLQQRNEMAELQNGVIKSIQQMFPQMAREMETALIQLALESVKKVVAGVKIDAKIVEAVVREALSQVQDTADISIQLNPEDLALLRKSKSPLLEELPGIGSLRFVTSADVTRGGCMIQTRFGIVDAQRETKLEQIQKAVTI